MTPAPERAAGTPDGGAPEVRATSPVESPVSVAAIAEPMEAPRASTLDRDGGSDGAASSPAGRSATAPVPTAIALASPPADGYAAPGSSADSSTDGAGAPVTIASVRPDDQRPTCTTAQLRRFIKSRPWVPMHELRRRFGIWGADDDVTPVRVGEHTIFVGLPGPEGQMLGELLQGGDVGYELSLDPDAPIVVGVYPMRPVPRS